MGKNLSFWKKENKKKKERKQKYLTEIINECSSFVDTLCGLSHSVVVFASHLSQLTGKVEIDSEIKISLKNNHS